MRSRPVDFLSLLTSSRGLAATLMLSAWVGCPIAGAQETATESSAAEQSDAPPVEVDPGEQEPGQGDLDEAVLKRINADTGQKLQQVERLLESALAKGLGKENQQLAKKMLASVQLQLGEGLVGAMRRGVAGAPAIRVKALEILQKAAENDPELAEAHVLVAQLVGDRTLAKESITKAIELYDDDADKQSAMLTIRARLQEDQDQQLADLNRAVELDPDNTGAFEARIAVRLNRGEIDEAVEEVQELIDSENLNVEVIAAAADALLKADRDDQALELLADAIEKYEDDDQTLERLYLIRSQVHDRLQNEEEALADMNRAIEIGPDNPAKLMQRALVAVRAGDIATAKRDLRTAINLNPRVEGLQQTALIRFFIATSERRIADSINEVKKLIKFEELDDRDEASRIWEAELGRLYVVDERPRQAIEVFDKILQRQPENTDVLRSRADALLAVGKHEQAIADYRDALKILESTHGEMEAINSTDPQASAFSGILNNLSWVLATSPNESARDGVRSLRLARQAARLTDYSEAHILSTLAAAHAERGDLQKAIEYSQRAVELATLDVASGEDPESVQLEQLQSELETYRQGEPWREKQDTEENDKPILAPEDLIDI